jgi:flagellar secretion chaperone FliS
MFGSVKYGANAYANIGVETGVVTASPHKLITMLFDGALVAITNAQQHMAKGNVAEKGQSISKAILIIDSGLRASLDKSAGGDIANNLDALYEYISGRLLQANLNNQPKLLDEAYGLLMELKNAWEAIADNGKAANSITQDKTIAPQPMPAYDPLMPRTSSLARA